MNEEELLLDIYAMNNELQEASDLLAKGVLNVDQLEMAHNHITNLFKEIRQFGVSRNDMETLNSLGLTDVETQYYTEMRSMCGLDVALEAEGSTDWLTIVLGGILAALTAVIAFFIGKLLKWIFGSSTSANKASSGAESKSVAKIGKDAPLVKIALDKNSKFGDGRGYLDLVAITKLGDDYLNGKVAGVLLDSVETALTGINANVGAMMRTGGAEAEALIQTSCDKAKLAEFVKNASRENASAVIESVGVSSITENLVKETFSYVSAMSADNLAKTTAVDANGNPLSNQKSVNAASQQVCKLRADSDFFSDKLTQAPTLTMTLDMSAIDFTDVEKRRAGLEKRLKMLENLGANKRREKNDMGMVSKLGLADFFQVTDYKKQKQRVRAAEGIIRRVVNTEIVYPTQYVLSLTNVVAKRLLQTMVKYKNVQAKLNVRWGGMFYQSELDKIKASVVKAKLSKDVTDQIDDYLLSIRGADVKEAFITLNAIAKLIKDSKPAVLNDMTTIKYYRQYKEYDLGAFAADDLYSKLAEVNLDGSEKKD